MHNFWKLRQVLVEHVSPVLRELHGLEPPEVFLLEYIGKSDLSPSEIAAQMRLPAHAISRRLDVLEKRLLIVRSLDASDARRRVLTLTPAGEAVLKEAAVTLEGQVADLLGVLEPGSLDAMLKAMEQLVQAHRAPPKADSSRCTPAEETL